MDEIKEKAVKGSLWTLLERFGFLSIQFLSHLVLARILMPDDFGTVGILLIFTNLSMVFIDSGLATALIQKKDSTNLDNASVFYTNFAIAIIVYAIVFFMAPYISRYFNNPNVTFYLRVIELMVVVDAFCAIQNTLLVKQMKFKEIAKLKIIAVLISASSAIICALCGLGIWSLVIQYLTFSVARSIMLCHYSRWKPVLQYSLTSMKQLWGFGIKLLGASLLSELYINLQSAIIGKRFTAADLGYYTQAKQLQRVPEQAISAMINNVSLPAYAQLQDEKGRFKAMLQQNIRLIAFLNTPVMVCLAILAEPLIVFLYTSKWLPSIPYFQGLCIGFSLLLVVHNCNLTALKALGRSDYVLYLEIIKKAIGVCLLLYFTKICGVFGIIIGLAINSVLELFLNGAFLGREIGYGPFSQLRDIISPILLSAVAGAGTWLVVFKLVGGTANILQILVGGSVFMALYFSGAYILKLHELYMTKKVLDVILVNFRKKKGE